MMGVLDALLIVALLAVVAPGVVRRFAAGRPAGALPTDAPARLLAGTIGFLPAGRADWGQAMTGELEQLGRRSQRWRFALGCLAATVLLPVRRAGAARLVIVLVGAAAVAGAALVAYTMVRYPVILASHGTRPALVAFAAVLAGCTVLALVLVRRGAPAGPALVGGPATAAVWAVFGYTAVTYGPAHPALSLLLLALPAAPLVVGVVATRGRSGSAGRRAALLAAVVTGIVLFLILAGATLLTAGGPYDAGQLRDFPGSRFPDLASYAVNDNLGTAMSLFLLASIVTAVLGCAAATVAARIRRAAPTA
jgi:hypothetical protein